MALCRQLGSLFELSIGDSIFPTLACDAVVEDHEGGQFSEELMQMMSTQLRCCD